jgi:hypothetical protein
MRLLAYSFLAVLPLAVHAASPVGLLPEDKTPVVLAEKERNPFGKNIPKAEKAAVVNEESRIRAIIENLPVAGVMDGRSGKKVLLGSLVLEEGRALPPVISRQTEKLRVVAVADDKVEVAFLESDGNPGLRKIVVELKMTPQVQFRVATPTTKKGGGEDFDGVLTKDALGTSQ